MDRTIRRELCSRSSNSSLNHCMDRPNCPHNPLCPRSNSELSQTGPHKSLKQTTHTHTVHTVPIHSAYCKTKRPVLERSQHKGTIHWGSEKSLTEAIYFPSQRESLFFIPASLHSASCRNSTTLRSLLYTGRRRGGEINVTMISLCCYGIHHLTQMEDDN